MSNDLQYKPKPVFLRINDKKVMFDPIKAEWASEKEWSEKHKKMESELRNHQLRLKQLSSHMNEISTEMVTIQKDLEAQFEVEKELQEEYENKIQIYESHAETKKLIAIELEKAKTKGQ